MLYTFKRNLRRKIVLGFFLLDKGEAAKSGPAEFYWLLGLLIEKSELQVVVLGAVDDEAGVPLMLLFGDSECGDERACFATNDVELSLHVLIDMGLELINHYAQGHDCL